MKGNSLVIVSLVLLSSVAVFSESDAGGRSIEWQILTKRNFSSQISLHPHLLLMVTVPWSGESRSLMTELAHAVTYSKEQLGALKLMLMYRSDERMLADAIGAREGITFLYYHHSVYYKYQGRFRAQNILSSIYSLMSLLPEELPLKPLNTPDDLKSFLESTDKAVLLLEFCGWTPKLLAKGNNNGTENGFGLQVVSNTGGLLGTDLNGESSRDLMSREKKDQKGMENEKTSCGVENGFRGIPGLGEFSFLNGSAPVLETENRSVDVGLSCSIEEFQQFDSFFAKFITIAREFFLPLERQRFGLVSERSILPSLGVEDSGSWSAMLYFAGCPGCSKIFKEGDDIKSLLQMQNSFVTELEDDGHDLEPSLPANKPSILLFVDRSSNSSAIREKSKEALDAFRELALKYQISSLVCGQNNDMSKKSSVQVFRASRSASEHPRLESSPITKNIKVKDKRSIMIMNEGKQVTLDNIGSDLRTSSLHEILAHFLQQKQQQAKLSSLAKEAGFQLLSDDFNIKIEHTLPSQAEVQSSQVSSKLPTEGLLKSSDDLDKDQPYMVSISAVKHEEISKPTDVEHSSQYNEEKTTYDGTDTQLISVESNQFGANHGLATAEDAEVEEKGSPVVKLDEKQLNFQGFKGSFIFSDGGYRLLRALTAGSKIPSMVIVDPISGQHFVFPEDAVLSYPAQVDFLDGFINGSLIPYQRSESVLVSPREAMRPPFVNLDFHEVDAIPRVTAYTFSDLVLGFNQSGMQNTGHAWKKDVLVLFRTSWCGFCQRMELVVREVSRALKGYANMLKSELRNPDPGFSSDKLKDIMLKLPLIYSIDCSLNECSFILKSMGQRELYPTLMLFPAETRNAVSYEGSMAVFDIIKFIAEHGSNSHHLIGEKGILWTEVGKSGRNHNLYASPAAVHEELSVVRDKYHEVLLKNRTPKKPMKYNQIRPRTANKLRDTAPLVVVGSILVATEKLLSVHPFDKSTILIVKVDNSTGFQGLIINKPINWNSLQELDEGLELIKEAPLSFGGPLIKRGMPLVALARIFIKDQCPEVLPGVYFLDQSATIQEIEGLKSRNRSVTDYWFFLGYSRWDWEQLFDEIAEGDWNVTNNNMGQLDWP